MPPKVTILTHDNGRPTAILIEDPSGISASDFHGIRIGTLTAALGLEPIEREPFKRPAKRRLDDDFYRAVAVAYRDTVARKIKNPRKSLALESATPADTVARWIGQARKRGFLANGRPGRITA